jgi:hypothetical protein
MKSAAVLRASREASQLAAMGEKLRKSAFASCGQGVEDAGVGDGPKAEVVVLALECVTCGRAPAASTVML